VWQPSHSITRAVFDEIRFTAAAQAAPLADIFTCNMDAKRGAGGRPRLICIHCSMLDNSTAAVLSSTAPLFTGNCTVYLQRPSAARHSPTSAPRLPHTPVRASLAACTRAGRKLAAHRPILCQR
jgi:hypothetical protein